MEIVAVTPYGTPSGFTPAADVLLTRGSRCAATPGYPTQPLRGWLGANPPLHAPEGASRKENVCGTASPGVNAVGYRKGAKRPDCPILRLTPRLAAAHAVAVCPGRALYFVSKGLPLLKKGWWHDTAVRNLLNSFDSLPDGDKEELAAGNYPAKRPASAEPAPDRRAASAHADEPFFSSTAARKAMPKALRGEVWLVDLGVGRKVRPCLVVSVTITDADLGARYFR